jgi:hypothetical protein
MNRHFVLTAAIFLSTLSTFSLAQSLPADEQSFFDKHISEVIQIAPIRLNSDDFLKVFSAPFYQVTVTIKSDDGSSQNQQVVVARSGDNMVNISRPGTDTDMPALLKMLNPSFKLKTDDDAKSMQTALDAAYPIVTDDDKKAEKFRHTANQWVFARGKFFNDDLGFVFQTDDSGAITSAKFTLKAP